MNNEIKAFKQEIETIFGPIHVVNYSTDLTPVVWPKHWILGTQWQEILRK